MQFGRLKKKGQKVNSDNQVKQNQSSAETKTSGEVLLPTTEEINEVHM